MPPDAGGRIAHVQPTRELLWTCMDYGSGAHSHASLCAMVSISTGASGGAVSGPAAPRPDPHVGGGTGRRARTSDWRSDKTRQTHQSGVWMALRWGRALSYADCRAARGAPRGGERDTFHLDPDDTCPTCVEHTHDPSRGSRRVGISRDEVRGGSNPYHHHNDLL